MIVSAATGCVCAQVGLRPIGTPPTPLTNTTVPTDTNGSNWITRVDCNGDGVADLISQLRSTQEAVYGCSETVPSTSPVSTRSVGAFAALRNTALCAQVTFIVPEVPSKRPVPPVI